MRSADYPRALEHAAMPVLSAIERDEQRAPKRLKPLFVAMRDLIFEPDLDLDRIVWDAGFEDLGIIFELREEIGQPPWSYLREGRLETAARLLLETPISLLEIGRMVGYMSPSSFRRTMRGFLGMSASQYRRRAPRILKQAGAAPAGADTDAYWERMLAGELSADEARALDAYLERLAPAITKAPPADKEAERWPRLRQTLAEGFVFTLKHLAFADQRRLVRDAVCFPDGTFFEQLSRQSQKAGPEDPQRGVEWALLAIDSLAANRMLETYPERAALAWARLALAHWRAGDLVSAEHDLEQSISDTERADFLHPTCWAPSDPPHASWQAECSRVTAAFAWHQGRRRQALTLAEDSVAAHRAAGVIELPKALLLRAELHAASADLESGVETRATALEEALADVEEALDLVCNPLRGELRAETSEGLKLTALSLWLRILVLIGDRAEMTVALPKAQSLSASLGAGAGPLLSWFEGHRASVIRRDGGAHIKTHHDADAPNAHGDVATPDTERLWREAHERFTALDDELWGARTALDLARLFLLEDRPTEATKLTLEFVATLGALVASADDLATLKTLGRAATPPAMVTLDHLDPPERLLEGLEWDQRASRALQLAL